MEKNIRRIKPGVEQMTEMNLKSAFFSDERKQYACDAATRLVRAASLLGGEACIGWQLETEESGLRIAAFAGGGAGVSGKDLEWIFSHCVEPREGEPTGMTELFAQGRRVYAMEDVDTENEPEGRFAELLGTLSEQGAVIRFLAGRGRGQILISLPEAMTLRLRTLLSMLMPDLVCREVTATESAEAYVCTETLQAVMADFLDAGMAVRRVRPVVPDLPESVQGTAAETEAKVPDPPEAESTSETDTFDDFDPDLDFDPDEDEEKTVQRDDGLDVLDLSNRAYTALRRYRLMTVGAVLKAQADNYSEMPRIGPKVREELKRKLSRITVLEEEKVDYTGMLDSLTGLENVKEQMRKIAAFARMKKDMEASGKNTQPIVLNMEFTGNPGTAKTTVARIAAGIFHEIGLLRSPKPLEVGRANLVARYVGHTADQVREIFAQASGRLLFIDEAYSLAEGGDHDFGNEAITTMVQEMENHREETVVVFAGYPGKMEELFDRNPGLRSRVPFTLRFADYTAEEMLHITENEAEKRGFSMAADAKEKAAAICQAAVERGGAGNGRFCRNLVEHAVLEYASRVYGEKGDERNQILRAEDFSDPGSGDEPEAKRRIGFGA